MNKETLNPNTSNTLDAQFRKAGNTLDADIITEKVRDGVETVQTKAKEYSKSAMTYAQAHPWYMAIGILSVTAFCAVVIYRNRTPSLLRRLGQ